MKILPYLAAVGVMMCGCARDIQTKEAVRQGVIDHLAGKAELNLSSMQLEVISVTFRQDEADATISFLPKGSSGGGMQMRYTLERKGNQWAVKSKEETGSSPHGAGETPAGGGQLPPGHPAIGEAPPPGKTP